MSLIQDCKDLKTSVELLTSKAEKQQAVYFGIINGLVKLHQKHRVAKEYAVSDEIRELLNSCGVKVQQGTEGYAYEDIPAGLKGKPVDDTWTIEKIKD